MTSTSMHDGRVVLHNADCRDVLRGMPDNSIDSVVTDPPYALVSIQKCFANSPRNEKTENPVNPYGRTGRGFMGKSWDNGETAFSEEFWAEVLRVLKPGGHVVAFSGTRTYHRMAVAIEDAGFEIRDQLGWLYGSGFPKSHNQHGDWEGWGTALKPAWEPIALARKPLIGTVAANLAGHGCGAINVDGCRVGMGDEVVTTGQGTSDSIYGGVSGLRPADMGTQRFTSHSLGRWPANVIHDGSDEVVAAFPFTTSGAHSGNYVRHTSKTKNAYGEREAKPEVRDGDSGNASRFFYCAKASRADRDAGLSHLPKQAGGMVSETSGQHITRRDEGYKPEPRANIHPTVKPTTLMQWLCRLITPPGGVVLDPFMGSGSTGKAAVLEGLQFVGVEREGEYMPIATARIAWAIGASTKGEPVAAHAQPAAPPTNDLFSGAANDNGKLEVAA